MKRVVHTTLAFLTLTLAVGAKDKPVFSLTAHVLSSGRSSAHIRASVDTTQVNGRSTTALTEMRVGTLIYSSEQVCKHAIVGHDYPAELEHGAEGASRFLKGSADRLTLQIGDKVCKYRVSAVREDKQ